MPLTCRAVDSKQCNVCISMSAKMLLEVLLQQRDCRLLLVLTSGNSRRLSCKAPSSSKTMTQEHNMQAVISLNT